jgi:hypothetical protein
VLYVSLIASALLVLFANWAARRARHPGPAMGCAAVTCTVGPFFMMCALPTVAIQALLLVLAVILWRNSGRDPSVFLRLSCGATLLAYALGSILVVRSERDYARLRTLYPYESMEDRIAMPKGRPAGTALRPESETRLAKIEAAITDQPNGMRERQLRLLHEDAVGLFVNSPGFGISRMFLPAEWNMGFGLRREPVPSQPGPPSSVPPSPGEWSAPPGDEEAALGRVLEDSVSDFVNSRGFGFFKDRRHVAGFETHRFQDVPAPGPKWVLRRLELVSLLVHDEPAVYVSDHLPQMDAMHRTPTRDLDRFETFALERLKGGDDVFVAEAGESLRMLGAVRSAKQCVRCHGGGRGDLLGAFSYALQVRAPDGSTQEE